MVKNVGIPRTDALLHGILPVSILQSLELRLLNITTVRFATRASLAVVRLKHIRLRSIAVVQCRSIDVFL